MGERRAFSQSTEHLAGADQDGTVRLRNRLRRATTRPPLADSPYNAS